MDRQQLAHLLRAACKVADDEDVLVLGSQSILGTYDEDDLPPQATASIEADLAFLNDPDRAKSDQVEAAIGELSAFHGEYGVYAESIHVSTATLPDGWRDRLTTWPVQSSLPARPWFLEPHDLAISKLVRGDEKDRAFVGALLDQNMLDVATLRERVGMLPHDVDERVTPRMQGWLNHYDKD